MERRTPLQREKEVGKAIVEKEFMDFHLQNCECLSWLSPCQVRRRLPVGLECDCSPVWSLTLFNWRLPCFNTYKPWKWKVNVLVTQSWPTLCESMACSLPGSSVHWDSSGKNPGEGSHSLLQVIVPTRDWTWISHIAGRYFTIWPTREAHSTPQTASYWKSIMQLWPVTFLIHRSSPNVTLW